MGGVPAHGRGAEIWSLRSIPTPNILWFSFYSATHRRKPAKSMALAAIRQCFDKTWWISGYNLADFFFCINHNIFRGEIFSFADEPKDSVKLGSYCTAVISISPFPKVLWLYWHPGPRISCSRNLLADLAGTVGEDKWGGTKGCCFPWAGSSCGCSPKASSIL